MNHTRQTFHKSERLCSTKVISGLFEDGNIFYNSLYKVVWAKSPVILHFPAQVAFSVSKKGFRRAVTRNLIKRRMREAYRINKSFLYDQLLTMDMQIVFVIILRGKVIPEYTAIEKSMNDAFKELIALTARKN